MKQRIGFTPISYQNQSFYDQKKATYSKLIILFVYMYAFSMFVVDLILHSQYLPILGQFLVVTIYIFVVLTLWKKGFIELATNLTVLLGFAYAVYLFYNEIALRFYMQLFMVMLVVTAGYIKRYQFTLTYTIFILLVIYRFIYEQQFRINEPFNATLVAHLTTLLGGLSIIFCLHFLKKISDRELQTASTLKEIMEHDTLTGLPNRRKFHSVINNYIGESDIVFILMDIDYFKSVNDDFGHSVGDDVLASFSSVLDTTIRSTDIAFRWGGEEFVVLLINTPLKTGIDIAERIRENIAHQDFNLHRQLTVSMGLVTMTKENSLSDLRVLIKKADDALYFAKENGRNQIKY